MAVPALSVTHEWHSTSGAVPIDKARREHVRWQCLVVLDQERPSVMTDAALLAVIRTTYPDAKERELRRALDYLESAGYLSTHRDEPWQLRLTYKGIDLVDFTTPCPPGIGRPISQS